MEEVSFGLRIIDLTKQAVQLIWAGAGFLPDNQVRLRLVVVRPAGQAWRREAFLLWSGMTQSSSLQNMVLDVTRNSPGPLRILGKCPPGIICAHLGNAIQ